MDALLSGYSSRSSWAWQACFYSLDTSSGHRAICGGIELRQSGRGSMALTVAGSSNVAFHDALFFNAGDAAELIGGFIPGVSLLISVAQLGDCVVKQ